MTKPPFPSKYEIASPSKSIKISLGLRVLLLCAVCVILPLAAYILVIRQEVRIQENRDIFEQLAHVSDAQKDSADFLFSEAFVQLRSARILEAHTTDREMLRSYFQDLLVGYPVRSLSLATIDAEGKYHVQMSTEKSLEGQVLPYGESITLPIERVFVYVCECSMQKVVVIGVPGKGEEKILLVFPADYLIRIAPDISEWAGSMGIALLKGNDTILQKEPMCSAPACRIFTDDEVRRILNDQSESPLVENQAMIGEISLLGSVPFSIRVAIEPIYYQTRYSIFLQYIAIILLLTVIFGAVVTFFLTRAMARPFNNLIQLMNKAGAGDLKVRYSPQYLAFEINIIGGHFNRMLEALTTAVEGAKKAHAAKETLLHECAIGHSIQRSIFPRLLPRLPQFDIAASFSPAEEVAGDFYDLFLQDTPKGKRLFIAIGDASGKGMAACLYSFLLRSMLRSFAAAGESLEQIAEHANQLFCLDTEAGGMFVTVWMGLLHIDDNRLEYASLGHYPALWKQSGGDVVELETKGSAFGMPFMEPIAVQTIHLNKGDSLLLYTDGWIETKRSGVTHNRAQLIDWLRKQPADTTSKEIIAALEKLFVPEESMDDDRTALVLRLQ